MSCRYDKIATDEGAFVGHKSKMPSDDRLLHKSLTYKVERHEVFQIMNF